MTNAHRLSVVRTLHTVIYVVMCVAIFVVLYAGATGARGWWLWMALALLALETAVFAGSGLRCPLTGAVARYAEGRPVSDTYFPERFTRHTLAIFGPLMAIGVVLIAVRFWLD
jgi:hypothetical protein